MDPTTIESLNTYFAVQVLSSENTHAVAGAICKAAQEAGTLFRRLEVLDTIQVAAKTFVRCRSDIVNPYLMLDALHAKKRGYVAVTARGQYNVKMADGRMGAVPGTVMHTVPRSGCGAMYRGPKIKLWERQFMA